MVELGKINRLTVIKILDFGCYLVERIGDELEILLPIRYVPDGCAIDDELDVFIYTDSEDRIIATTETPKALVGEIANLTVVANTNVGAFLDMGLSKDLLVPYREQLRELQQGQRVPVYLYVDENSKRIAGTTKLNRLLADSGEFELNQPVDYIIYDENEYGFMACVNKTHRAMIHHTDIHKNLDIGDEGKAFIKKIREDGKIDLALHRFGYDKVADETENILAMLKENDGFLFVTDKSKPDLINSMFGISKAVYKKAVGKLYKDRKITIEAEGIRLVDNSKN